MGPHPFPCQAAGVQPALGSEPGSLGRWSAGVPGAAGMGEDAPDFCSPFGHGPHCPARKPQAGPGFRAVAGCQDLGPDTLPGVPATGEPSPALRSSMCPLMLQGLHRRLRGLLPSRTGAVPRGGVLEAERDGRGPPLVETPFWRLYHDPGPSRHTRRRRDGTCWGAAGPSGGGPPNPSWRPDRQAGPCPALGCSDALRPGSRGCRAWNCHPPLPRQGRVPSASSRCCRRCGRAGGPPSSAEDTRTHSCCHHRGCTFIETMYRQATQTGSEAGPATQRGTQEQGADLLRKDTPCILRI